MQSYVNLYSRFPPSNLLGVVLDVDHIATHHQLLIGWRSFPVLHLHMLLNQEITKSRNHQKQDLLFSILNQQAEAERWGSTVWDWQANT